MKNDIKLYYYYILLTLTGTGDGALLVVVVVVVVIVVVVVVVVVAVVVAGFWRRRLISSWLAFTRCQSWPQRKHPRQPWPPEKQDIFTAPHPPSFLPDRPIAFLASDRPPLEHPPRRTPAPPSPNEIDHHQLHRDQALPVRRRVYISSGLNPEMFGPFFLCKQGVHDGVQGLYGSLGCLF